jgi:nucleolar protein 53
LDILTSSFTIPEPCVNLLKMPDNLGAPSQPSQPSRKGKKAWRKNVDITPVTSGLESLREEIRSGGPITEKPSSELFVFDTKGSDEIRRKTRGKTLKVDEILAQRSAVPGLEGRRGFKRGIGGVGDGIFEEGDGKRRKEWVSKAEVMRLRERLDKSSHLESEQIEEGVRFDLWEENPSLPKTLQDEYVPKPQKKIAPKSIKQKPIAMTASGKAVKAVANPGAGTSYNPSFEEWDDLLNREGVKEVEAEQARLVKEQERAEKEARVAAIAAADGREGQSDYESAWEGFSENDKETLKKKRPERKTPAQRNKVKRKQKEEQQKRHEKASGDREKRNVDAVLALVKSNSEQALIPAEDDHNSDGDEGTQLRRRKMGNTVIPEKPLELVLPEELQESLRRLKPEGNLMSDRFRNLLVNGKIESRKPIYQAKKKKVKMTEKWSYKDFEIPV